MDSIALSYNATGSSLVAASSNASTLTRNSAFCASNWARSAPQAARSAPHSASASSSCSCNPSSSLSCCCCIRAVSLSCSCSISTSCCSMLAFSSCRPSIAVRTVASLSLPLSIACCRLPRHLSIWSSAGWVPLSIRFNFRTRGLWRVCCCILSSPQKYSWLPSSPAIHEQALQRKTPSGHCLHGSGQQARKPPIDPTTWLLYSRATGLGSKQ